MKTSSRTLILLAVIVASCNEDPQGPQPFPPTASFIVTPTSGLTTVEFLFDASSTTDREDPTSAIEVRWDWEYDGEWDLGWTREKLATHRFETEGPKTVRLQVRDTSGMTDQVTRFVSVRFNHLPETTVTTDPVTGFTAPLVHVYWSGSDTDGDVAAFLIALDDSASWHRTTKTDSVFEMTPGTHTIYATAVDNDGQRDPSPASISVDVPESSITTPSAAVSALMGAYANRSLELLAVVLANRSDQNAVFAFVLSEPTESGETEWGLEEELRIHRRMFHPEQVPPNEDPIPLDLWLQAVTVWGSQLDDFVERSDLYTSNGGKLDPAMWRALSARFTMGALFEMQGETDYAPQGDFAFVVIEDRAKDFGDARKFLILTWEELNCDRPQKTTTSGRACWSSLKRVYR